MTVRELVGLLQGEPNQDREVVLSKDAEGNSYSPLYGTWVGRYSEQTSGQGDAGMECLDDELRAEGYNDEDVMADGVPALILSPIV